MRATFRPDTAIIAALIVFLCLHGEPDLLDAVITYLILVATSYAGIG